MIPKSINRNLFLVLPLILLNFLTGERSFAAQACSKLFSDAVPTNTLEFIATEKSQLIRLIQELTDRIKFTSADPDLLKRLSILKENISGLVELNNFQINAREIIEIVHEYNVRLAKRKGASTLDILALDTLLGGFRGAQKDIKAIEKFLKKQKVTSLQFLESATNLSVRALLDYLANGFFALGISIDSVPADGMLMKPPGFYLHDVGHAERFITALRLIAEDRNLNFDQVWGLFKNRLSNILIKINQVQDPMMREQLEWIVFYEVHETYGPRPISDFIFDVNTSQQTMTEFSKDFRSRADKEFKLKVKEKGHSWKNVFDTYISLKQSLAQ